jgi:hypothetical protein
MCRPFVDTCMYVCWNQIVCIRHCSSVNVLRSGWDRQQGTMSTNFINSHILLHILGQFVGITTPTLKVLVFI